MCTAINFWREIAPPSGIWLHQGYFCNTTIVKVRPDFYLVVSPTKDIPKEVYSHLLESTHTIVVLAPNHFHHLGIDLFKVYFPSTVVVSSNAARKRLIHQINSNIQDLEALIEQLPSHMQLIIPEGTKNGEVWIEISLPSGDLLIIGDAFVNFTDKVQGLLGLVLDLCQAAPQLQISKTWKWFGLGNIMTYRSWINAYFSDYSPHWVVPLHGNVIEGLHLNQDLINLVEQRLG